MMNNPKAFLEKLQNYDKDNIPDWALEKVEPIITTPGFTKEDMMKKSEAAANLCGFVVNIVKYNKIYRVVAPLMEGAKVAEAQANEALAELKEVQDYVAEIVAKVNALKAQLQEAEDKKAAVVAEADALQSNLNLAGRLVGGLADENVRWKKNVENFKKEKLLLVGDTLVAAAFVSYIGPFSSQFRVDLWKDTWIPDIENLKIPFTEGLDPLYVLSNASQQASWQTEGLPADRVSIENAAVVVSCSRYPLMIDPQLQGIKWIKGREGGEMVSLQMSTKNWIKKVELAVSGGQVLMLDSIGSEIDAVLDPLLSRAFVKKGKALICNLGGEEVEVMPTFKLYLQTKLQNPHYKPEIAAQCTIINFIVTESGLEDQLLALVVKSEKPELEAQKEQLTEDQNMYVVKLAELETNLLNNLTDANPDTILENIELIDSLEVTKKTSIEIQQKQEEAKTTEIDINRSRETYRPVAAEGAMLYFLLIQLCIIDFMYQYSLESFTTFFFKAIEKTEDMEEEEKRV